jgi:hypothetical protein
VAVIEPHDKNKEHDLKQIRKRLTYANVMSSLAVFLILGGATAIAAKTALPKKSVGTKQLKANAVTPAKLKKNAVTAVKIKDGAVTGAKIAAGTITGANIAAGSITGTQVNASTLGTVPNSATTSVIRSSKGTLSQGQEAVALEQGPLKVIVKCEVPIASPGRLSAHAFIASATGDTVFATWEDGSSHLGPNTPEDEREITDYGDGDSGGPFGYESLSEGGVSASASNGASFNAFVGLAAEKDTNTCWYWLNATILG